MEIMVDFHCVCFTANTLHAYNLAFKKYMILIPHMQNARSFKLNEICRVFFVEGDTVLSLQGAVWALSMCIQVWK